MTSPLRQQAVNAEFLTRSYRISGEVSVRSDPLLDQLNDHLALFVHVERVFVSPLLDPATLTGNFRSVEVRKDTLGLVVLSARKNGLPHRQVATSARPIERPFVRSPPIRGGGVMSLHPSVNVAE